MKVFDRFSFLLDGSVEVNSLADFNLVYYALIATLCAREAVTNEVVYNLGDRYDAALWAVILAERDKSHQLGDISVFHEFVTVHNVKTSPQFFKGFVVDIS